MKVVIIGSGNVATHISHALSDGGNEIVQVFSKTAKHAETLACSLGCDVSNDSSQIVNDADIYLISASDKAIEKLIPQLCQGRENGIFVHTSGSTDINVFNNYARRYGVIYPMQTFTKSRTLDFRDIPCFVEASDKETETTLCNLAKTISDNVTTMASQQRKVLHLAAVFSCNFVNYCYQASYRLLTESGIPFRTMLPLIDETASKIHDMPPYKAQTGPAVRNDITIIDKHLSMLESDNTLYEIYKIMSEGIYKNSQL